MLNSIFKKDLKGGALYYVIFVSFMLTSFALLFIMFRFMKYSQIRHELNYFKRSDQITSALVLYLSKPAKYQNSDTAFITFCDDTVKVWKRAYGLLDIITASIPYRGITIEKKLLAGKDPFHGDSIVLNIPDLAQTLYASGETIIKGNALLPEKGMQRASIEGRLFRGDKIVQGSVSMSTPKMTNLNPKLVKKIKDIQNIDSISQSAINISQLVSNKVLKSISDPVQWYYSNDNFQISEFNAKGAIGFLSRGTIVIKKDAHLEDVLISAKSLIVEEGFDGSMHLFAKDSLIIGKKSRLRFPSSLCIYNEKVNPVFLAIKEGSRIEGSVIVCQEHLSTRKPMLVIEEGALVSGEIYHKGTIELIGKIHGSLSCEGFYRKTKQAYYENHLLDNEINFHLLPNNYVSIDFKTGYSDQIIDFLSTAN